MHGIRQKLNDSKLYLLHDMTERLLVKAETELAETTKEDKEKVQMLKQRIERFKNELQDFEADIAEQRKQSFQFSVEELYYMYGQYDKFIAIEFHKFSEAAKKYGKEVGGIIMYGRKERESLEALIKSGSTFPRTNGVIKLDAASNYGLTEEQITAILDEGFLSGNIYKILSTNMPVTNAYSQQGEKEIPNTINVPFNPKGTHPAKLSLYVLNMRLQHGSPLIEKQWNQYLGYSIYFEPELKQSAVIKQRILKQGGSIKDEVRFYELTAKMADNLTEDEKVELSDLLKKRTQKRLSLLTEEIAANNYQSLEKFKKEHTAIYQEIYRWSLVFEEETLTHSEYPIPIYWDFRSYLHIYLRHCKELQPEGTFKTKTPFSYNEKDIRRILKIAVEKLEPKIQERLQAGKDFRIFGEKSLYYNGNYYFMRVEPNGRVESFHPYEAK